MQSAIPRRLAKATTLLTPWLWVGAAHAHTGHVEATLWSGLVHPFGLDHLLAMVAVGVWAMLALPREQRWAGPLAFMAALVIGALLGAAGLGTSLLEPAIALSVASMGVLLFMSRQALPKALGLSVVATIGALHGLAHGAEAPAGGMAAYALGFLLTTAALHLGGMGLGLSVQRLAGEGRRWALTSLSAVLGGAGVFLFTQL